MDERERSRQACGRAREWPAILPNEQVHWLDLRAAVDKAVERLARPGEGPAGGEGATQPAGQAKVRLGMMGREAVLEPAKLRRRANEARWKLVVGGQTGAEALALKLKIVDFSVSLTANGEANETFVQTDCEDTCRDTHDAVVKIAFVGGNWTWSSKTLTF